MAAQKKKRSSKPYRVKDKSEGPSERRVLAGRVGWLTLTALWVFVVVALVSFDAGDAPSHAVFPHNEVTANWGGPVGAHVGYGILRFVGLGVLVPVVFSGVMITLRLTDREMTQPLVRAVGAVVLTAALSTLLGVLAPNLLSLPGLSGGTVGVVGAAELLPRFAMLGTLVWIGTLTVIGLLVCCDRYLWEVPMMVWARIAPTLAHTSERAGGAAERAASRANEATGRAASGTRAAGGGVLGALGAWLKNRKKPVMVRANDIDPDMVEVKPSRVEVAAEEAPRVKPRRVVKPVPQTVEEIEEDEGVGAPQVFDRDKLREKIEALPVRFAQDNKTLATDEDLADFQDVQNLEGYRFPTMGLLEEPELGFNEKLEALVREQAEALEHSLMQYKIDGEVVDIESGPAITLYHIRLAPGTKVAQINAIESDLARSLKAVNIRVVANMEGRDTIGVEVPNPTKERVRLKELMSNRERFSKMKLPMFLGKDAAGDPLISDLTKMPHMLIAGTTGSGKSVCMNTIIMSFLYTKRPDELKLVLVDPKMVEMSQFKDIPHLMCPVVTEMPKAAAILEWAVTKMDERYELLADAGCRDISSYNELELDELKDRLGIESEEQLARVPKKLPYMVFIIDELADLMMTNKEVEGAIIRIAQKARAVGIHLILATQRPQANVVTGLIKSNMPCRIAFKVASGMDSRIVLDQKGGELLLGQGDMLFLSPDSHKLSRAQGTLVDDAEIRKVVRFLKDIAAPSFERSLMQVKGETSDEERIAATENNSSASLAAAQEDPMFDRAVEIVLETKRGSVSLLQRRLAIGYTRASRLIDLMGIAGIISDHKGSVARDVMISIEEWELMKEMAAEMERQQQAGASEGGDPEDPHQTTMFVEPESEPLEGAAGLVEEVPFEADGDDAGVTVHAQRVHDGEEPEIEMLLDDAEALVDELADDAAADEEESDDEEDAECVAEEDEEDDEEYVDEAEDDEEDDADAEYVDEEDGEDEEEDEDAEYVDEEEEGDEEEEDGEEIEYEYVDEDGNPIDPSELDGDEYEVDDEVEEGEEDEEYEEEDAYEDEEEDEHAHA